MRNKLLLATIAGSLLFCALLLSSLFSPQTLAATRNAATPFVADSRTCPTTVSKGSSGAAVSELQWELAWAFGYNLTIDGDFGPDTDTAVRNFQGHYALPINGVVDAATWHTLDRC